MERCVYVLMLSNEYSDIFASFKTNLEVIIQSSNRQQRRCLREVLGHILRELQISSLR